MESDEEDLDDLEALADNVDIGEEDLDELEALANSLSDDDSVNSSDDDLPSAAVDPIDIETEINIHDIEDVDTKEELSKSISVAGDLNLSWEQDVQNKVSIIGKPESLKTEPEQGISRESVISVNVGGVDPDSVLMTDCHYKSISLISIPPNSENMTNVSFDSALSVDKNKIRKTSPVHPMSSLQEMFDNISSNHESVDEACEEIEVEFAVDVVENQGPNNLDQKQQKDSLFSDYTLDDIITGNITEETREKPDNHNGHEYEDEGEEVESEESSSDEEDESNFMNLYDLCDNYIDHLQNMLEMLQQELDRNQYRQEQIELEVTDLIYSGVIKKKNEGQHKIISRKPISIFAYPYFKDQDLFGPPPNEDMIRKKQNKELDVWIEFPKPFSEEDRRRLKKYIKQDAVRIKSIRLFHEKENLETKLNTFVFDEAVKETMSRQLMDIIRKIDEVRDLPDDKMFVDRFDEYDWVKISVTDFKNSHSPRECQLQWQNLIHPSINRSVYSPNEDKLLKRLAEALQAQDWDNIAKEIETGRTPHQCFVRYMTRHNVVINNRKWERSEDDRLRRLIAHCRINNYIPWTKVAYYMERRTKEQCYQRYVYSLKDVIKKGPFSEAEDMLLFLGEKLFKTDWVKICEMLPQRTPIQLHCRFNHFLKSDHKPWIEEEDVALLEHVRKHGLRDWVLVANELKLQIGGDRTRSQCRQRFQFIYKCFKKNPAMALGNIEYKDGQDNIAKRRLEEIYDKLSERFDEWKLAELNAGTFDDPSEVKTAKGFGHIELPNGEVVSRRSLTRFIRFIQEFLPAPNPPEPIPRLERRTKRCLPHVEPLFKRPLSKPKLPKSKKLKITGYDHQKFKRVKKRMLAGNRDRLGKANFKTVLDRNITKFFRTTWILRNNKLGYMAFRYSDKDVEMLATGGVGLGHILKMKTNFFNKEIANTQDDESWLLQTLREKQLLGHNRDPLLAVEASSPKVRRTYGKTYGRQTVKKSNSRVATPLSEAGSEVDPSEKSSQMLNKRKLDFVPPNVATLVGFRGLLLTNTYLADPDNHSENIKREKDSVDETVRRGFEPGAVGVEEPRERIVSTAHMEVDRLLVQRFLQFFLWPAKMSSIPPCKQETLFSDSSDED